MATNQELLAALVKPSDYQSNYQTQIDSLLNNILNREAFSYNPQSDNMYNLYRDQYQTQGKKAMLDTVAATSAQTGGYGNSYAASAGNQAYQSYLQQANDKIPELYQAALDAYNTEGDRMSNNLSLLNDIEDTNYGKYRDTVSDYNNDRSYYATQAQQDTENSQWQQNFDYQKERDAVADEQWEKEYALKKASSSGSGGSGTRSTYTGNTSGSEDVTPVVEETPVGNQNESYWAYLPNGYAVRRGKRH